MAKRGEVARAKVYELITKAFDKDFVCVQDKKIYVNATDENGEMIQFSIAITQPKNPIGELSRDWNEGSAEAGNPIASPRTEVVITDEEEERVRKLMEDLGIV